MECLGDCSLSNFTFLVHSISISISMLFLLVACCLLLISFFVSNSIKSRPTVVVAVTTLDLTHSSIKGGVFLGTWLNLADFYA